MTEKKKSAVEIALEAKENLELKKTAIKVCSSDYFDYMPSGKKSFMYFGEEENVRTVPDVVERADNEHAQTVRLHGFKDKGKGKSQQDIRDAAEAVKRKPALASAHVTPKGVKFVRKSGTYDK